MSWLLASMAWRFHNQKEMRFDNEKFYLGKLCKKGHNYDGTGKSLRRKRRGICVVCDLARSKKWAFENKAKSLASAKSHYSKNQELILARKKEWRVQNPEKNLVLVKKYKTSDHGRLALIFYGMRERCFNIKHPSYHRYGGRGITICGAWLNSLNAFRKWALANGYAFGLTIDRKDNNGNYCPGNCQWLTKSANSKKGVS